ncbi:hypothetical protein OY671_002325 [Metschnikowia pulcherrima]|nr:hypothetical protein OY671_002325 [Metschnikowia pulcherrima]
MYMPLNRAPPGFVPAPRAARCERAHVRGRAGAAELRGASKPGSSGRRAEAGRHDAPRGPPGHRAAARTPTGRAHPPPKTPQEDTMADRSSRGMSIGAKSMESDEGVDFAPRFQAHYDCPNGHTIISPFSTDAEVPPVWECRCGAEASSRDAERPEPKAGKPARTHWDMSLERRTISELEELLDERLGSSRAGKSRRSA